MHNNSIIIIIIILDIEVDSTLFGDIEWMRFIKRILRMRRQGGKYRILGYANS
jgi:hypothetical protein